MKELMAICICEGVLALSLSADALTGRVVAWGDNTVGQATGLKGFGSNYSVGTVMFTNETVVDAIYVSAGYFHSLALGKGGEVLGWGGNLGGKVTGTENEFPHRAFGPVVINSAPLNDATEIAAAGSFSLALKRDGTVVSWGKCQVPTGLSNVTAIAAGDLHALALLSNGSVVCWGDRNGSLAGVSNVVAIAAARSSFWHDLALTREGKVVEQRSLGPEVVQIGSTNIIAISAGFNHSLALMSDGTVFGWGGNSSGQATGIQVKRAPDDPSQSHGLVTLNGQVLSNIVAIAAGREYSLALKKDGSLVAWGNSRFHLEVPAGLTNVTAIAVGDGFCLAITTNSQVAAQFSQKH